MGKLVFLPSKSAWYWSYRPDPRSAIFYQKKFLLTKNSLDGFSFASEKFLLRGQMCALEMSNLSWWLGTRDKYLHLTCHYQMCTSVLGNTLQNIERSLIQNSLDMFSWIVLWHSITWSFSCFLSKDILCSLEWNVRSRTHVVPTKPLILKICFKCTILLQGIVEVSASKPAFVQDTNYRAEKTYHIAPYSFGFFKALFGKKDQHSGC